MSLNGKMKILSEVTFSGFFGEKGTYFHGDTVTGTLYLETFQHLNVTAVRLTFRGQAFVHWTEQQVRGGGEPRYKDVHHYSSSEDYFEHSIVLYGKGSTNKPEKCFLPAGRYSYPFQYQLPPSLPSSFEGDHGYVRYWVRATVEKGRDLLCVTKKPFSVVSPLDLNIFQSLKSPLQETKEKKLCCLCCWSGPIAAMLCVAKRGFVPGEPVRFGAEISNMSSRKMGCSSVELKMVSLKQRAGFSLSSFMMAELMTRHDALKFLEADTDINEPNVLLKQCIKAIRDPKTKSFDQ